MLGVLCQVIREESMSRYMLAICWLCLGITLGFAQNNPPLDETVRDSFDADFPSGGQLRMHIRSGDLKVVGGDEDKIRIRYWGKNAQRARHVKISLRTVGSRGELRVHGGPRNNFQIEIRVPKISDLYLRMPAGDAQVGGIKGNKDVEIHAGDLMLQVGAPEEYALANGSVLAGDLDAGPFGVSKDGLFRSFHHQGPGKYTLYAHVGAGDLTLKP
jgi:hypothetical protein